MAGAVLRSAAGRLTFGGALWPALAGWIVGMLLRHFVVEPTHIIHACDLAPWQGWCAPRSMLIQAFATQGLGWFALAAGVLALWRRSRRLAALALTAGAAGLVLYCVEPSVVGVLAGALVFARPPARGTKP
ncbi:MAG TPA: hypothetical protein PKA20_14400 [Burkholderiaceae bacterium]|nr:hypothetical protein [Burkholderiaceae bacterium]